MEATSITFLNDLDISRDDYTIRVRIIRLWRQPMFKNPSQTFSIEMILIDEQGNKIQASVLHKWFTRFERFLTEKATLIIRKPTLGDNIASFRYVDNPLKVCLYYNTTLTKCTDFSGPLYGFSFSSFRSILDLQVSESGSIDVIGIIVRYFKLEDLMTKSGKQASKLNIQIKDLEGLKISVTLWDDYARQLSEYLENNADACNIVVILQFGRFKRFKDGYSVSNSYAVSRLFINSDIDEILKFKKNYVEKNDGESRLTVGLPASSMLVSISDDFLIKTEFNSIAEVNEISEVKSVVVVGHVKLIISEVEWFYQSCKLCMKKVYRKDNTNAIVEVSKQVEDNELYKCRTRTCENMLIDVVPRFKIPIRVQDASGIVSLTIFDREAKRFLKKNASDLYEDYLQGDGMCVYPEIFNSLLDRKFAFKIDITDFNIENNYKFYGVSKMTEDPYIISELEKKFQLEHGPASESLNLTSQDFKSMDTSTFKDAISCTGDNETPMSILDKSNSNGTTGVDNSGKNRCTGASLKRNLVEIYDVDEMASSSATKAYKDSSTDALKETKHQLLTPKIEK